MKAKRGQSLVESSIALVVFLSLVLSIIDGARLFLARTSAAGQLREIARWAALHPDDAAAIRTQAERAGFRDIRVVHTGAGQPTERITIRALSAPAGQITPWFGSGSFPLEASALVER